MAFALGLAVVIIAIQWWIARKDTAAFLVTLTNERNESAKALAAAAAANRQSEEAKNERILSFGSKLAEVVVENTVALERLTETVRDRK